MGLLMPHERTRSRRAKPSDICSCGKRRDQHDREKDYPHVFIYPEDAIAVPQEPSEEWKQAERDLRELTERRMNWTARYGSSSRSGFRGC